jgi:hypothetical protein
MAPSVYNHCACLMLASAFASDFHCPQGLRRRATSNVGGAEYTFATSWRKATSVWRLWRDHRQAARCGDRRDHRNAAANAFAHPKASTINRGRTRNCPEVKPTQDFIHGVVAAHTSRLTKACASKTAAACSPPVRLNVVCSLARICAAVSDHFRRKA